MTDREELKKIIKESIAESFQDVGLFPGDSEELRKDFIFLRSFREGSADVKKTSRTTAISACVAGACWLFWESIKK